MCQKETKYSEFNNDKTSLQIDHSVMKKISNMTFPCKICWCILGQSRGGMPSQKIKTIEN